MEKAPLPQAGEGFGVRAQKVLFFVLFSPNRLNKKNSDSIMVVG
jgi:hypothetical protein